MRVVLFYVSSLVLFLFWFPRVALAVDCPGNILANPSAASCPNPYVQCSDSACTQNCITTCPTTVNCTVQTTLPPPYNDSSQYPNNSPGYQAGNAYCSAQPLSCPPNTLGNVSCSASTGNCQSNCPLGCNTGTYTNLCGTGTTASGIISPCNTTVCNTTTGTCRPSGNQYAYVFVCQGQQSSCESGLAAEGLGRTLTVTDYAALGSRKTVQIDVFRKNCLENGQWVCDSNTPGDLESYMVWYSGEPCLPSQQPQKPPITVSGLIRSSSSPSLTGLGGEVTIEGVNVQMTNLTTGASQIVTTNELGYFSVSDLVRGGNRYQVQIVSFQANTPAALYYDPASIDTYPQRGVARWDNQVVGSGDCRINCNFVVTPQDLYTDLKADNQCGYDAAICPSCRGSQNNMGGCSISFASAPASTSFTWDTLKALNCNQSVTPTVSGWSTISAPPQNSIGVTVSNIPQGTYNFNLACSNHLTTLSATDRIAVGVQTTTICQTLSVTPTLITLETGGTFQTAALQGVDGASANITWISSNTSIVTVVPSPDKLTATITPSPTQTGTATITITNSAFGDCPQETATINATVNSSTSPTFTLSATPSTRYANPGQTANYTITLRGTNGFAGLVTLSATQLTGGATSFEVNPISVVTNEDHSTPMRASGRVGNHTIVITATNETGTIQKSTGVRLNVIAPLPVYSYYPINGVVFLDKNRAGIYNNTKEVDEPCYEGIVNLNLRRISEATNLQTLPSYYQDRYCTNTYQFPNLPAGNYKIVINPAPDPARFESHTTPPWTICFTVPSISSFISPASPISCP